jgi:glutathione S-transferase
VPSTPASQPGSNRLAPPSQNIFALRLTVLLVSYNLPLVSANVNFKGSSTVAISEGEATVSELEIIGGPASNFVWACRIACGEKGVPYKLVPVMPHTPEVTAIHPLGKIPAMRHGNVTLGESRAICSYIDCMFDGPPLTTANPVKAAQVEQWLSIVNTAIDPVWVRQYVAAYFFPGTADGSPNRDAIAAALPKMEKQFPMMDAAVANGYLVGDTFTLADANLIPILFYMSRLPESSALLAKYPNLTKYLERHLARDSVKQSMPQSLPGTAGTPAGVAA